MSERRREIISRYFDRELPDDLIGEAEELLRASEEAREYLDRLARLRTHLRSEGPNEGPDVVAAVIRKVSAQANRPGRSLPSLAAAFAAGLVVGAVFIGLTPRQPGPVAVAEIPQRILAAQTKVASFEARLEVTERGWHPDVPERVYDGTIAYRAPESLWIEMRDRTGYPSDEWVENHSTLVVDESVSWSISVLACPTEALPGCTPRQPSVHLVTGREPFPDEHSAPLDLVVPVGGFLRAGAPTMIGARAIEGRRAVGVEVPAAQVEALLGGLTLVGNWREVHPTDRVELWLDQDALVPLALSVYPADSEDRELWAIRRGYRDTLGVAILEVRWFEVTVNRVRGADFPPAPEGATGVDAGFLDRPQPDRFAGLPQALPEGMVLHRSGVAGGTNGVEAHVLSWSDGRAWLKLRWTTEWGGSRLFGDLGTLVREIPVGSGTGYVSERGDRLAIHGEDMNLVLMGSLSTEDLVAIAERLQVTGLVVPPHWAEAATATVDDALAAVPGLLLPSAVEGFSGPAVRVESGVAILSYSGPGNRAFMVTQARGTALSPPLEAKVRGVSVRGFAGRYGPDRGLLEWVEGDLVIGVFSTTLSLEELVGIAESLSAP